MALGGGGGGGGGGGSARGIRAGEAYVELNGKDNLSGFLGKMKATFVGAMKALGTAAIVGIGAGFSAVALAAGPLIETITDLGKIQDVADAFGITGRAASGLFGVLGAVGGEFKENVEGIVQFSQTMQDAIGGAGGQAAKLFDGLTVKAKDLAGVQVDEQFYRVLAAIREMPQGLQESKLAMLGGSDSLKQWQRLLSMSNEEVRGLADKLAFSNAELQQAANASHAYQRATLSVQRAWQQIAVAVAPVVRQIAEWVEQAADGFTQWIKGRSIVNLLDEVWVRAKMGVQETVIFLRDGLSAIWETFTTGENFAKFTSALWALVKSLVGYVINSLATAVPIITRGLTELVKTALFVSASLKNVLGDAEGGKADAETAARLDPDIMRAAIKAAMDADAAEFDKARGKLDQVGKDLADNFRKSAAKNADQDRDDRELLEAQLKGVQAEAERQRAQARWAETVNDFLFGASPAVQQKMADVGRSLGTFGGNADFVARGLGGEKNVIPKKIDVTNDILRDLLKTTGDLVKKPGGVYT